MGTKRTGIGTGGLLDRNTHVVTLHRVRPRPPGLLANYGKDDRAPRRLEMVDRARLQADELQDFEFGESFVRSRNVRRPREIVRMPDREEYWHRLEGEKPWDYKLYGVPASQLDALARGLLENDAELWESQWVPKRLKRRVREMQAEQGPPRRPKDKGPEDDLEDYPA